MTLEENIYRCIEERGVTLTVVSRRADVPYSALYNSLANKKSKRELKGKELVNVCKFLDIDPREFAEQEERR